MPLFHNNDKLKDRRRELRQRSTREEKILWSKIRDNKLGYKFKRQHSVGGYILDFYCSECRLIIEVDGKSHSGLDASEYDIIRDRYLSELGYKTIRFFNIEIQNKIEEVLIKIKNHLTSLFLMDKNLVFQKFGGEYFVNLDTFHMGIHHLLGEAIAKRFSGHNICLDTCTGAGFTTIALAKYVDKVIGVDINPLHLEQAKYNAKVALVEGKTEFILGDVLEAIKTIKEIDSAWLDPDWAKVGDSKDNHVSDLSQMVPPADLLLQEVFRKTKNVCLRLPKKFDLSLVRKLPEHEIESVFLDNQLKFYCVYFGDLKRSIGNTGLKILS